MTKAWIPTNFDDVCKRAAGRRRYHAERQKIQWKRQLKVLSELEQANWETFGKGRMLARELGVSEATISRDIKHWRALRIKLGPEAIEIIPMGLKAWQAS